MFQRQLLRSSRAASQQLSRSFRVQQISSSPFSSLSSISKQSSQSAIPQYVSRRWQSTETAKDAKPAEGDAKPAESSAEDVLKQEVEKKNKEIIDLKDKYLRSVADYRNLQDRMARDSANARNFAIQKFAADLLESIDNLDRALTAVPEAALGKSSDSTSPPNKDLVNLHSGLRMTEEILLGTLKKHGLEKYDPLEREGNKFDPNLDEATFFTKVEGKNDGEVFYTQSKGYLLNGRVIRASKVGVVKNS